MAVLVVLVAVVGGLVAYILFSRKSQTITTASSFTPASMSASIQSPAANSNSANSMQSLQAVAAPIIPVTSQLSRPLVATTAIIGPGVTLMGTGTKGQAISLSFPANMPALQSLDPTITWNSYSVGNGMKMVLSGGTNTMAMPGPVAGNFIPTGGWNTGYTNLVIVPLPMQSMPILSGGGGTSTVVSTPTGK